MPVAHTKTAELYAGSAAHFLVSYLLLAKGVAELPWLEAVAASDLTVS